MNCIEGRNNFQEPPM